MSFKLNLMRGVNSIGNTIFKNPVLWVAEDSFALTNERQPGTEFIFSKCDKDLVAPYRWSMDKEGYVSSRVHKTIKAHILIIGKQVGKVIDHVNRNKADNRRENLRHVTIRENTLNSDRFDFKLNQQFLGVSKIGNSFRANGDFNQQYKSLGTFKTPAEAALCYDWYILTFRRAEKITNFSLGKYSEIFLLEKRISCEDDILKLTYQITSANNHRKSSSFYGVRPSKCSWGYRICSNGSEITKYGFKTELEAAQAREQWLIHHPDCKAKRNFPDE